MRRVQGHELIIQVSQLRNSLEALLGKAVADREEMVNLLNRTYKLSPLTDVLALNSVLRSLQDKVVQWEYVGVSFGGTCQPLISGSNEFADVEKSFMPSEKDLKRSEPRLMMSHTLEADHQVTANHLKKLFPNQEVFNTLDKNSAGVSVAEADEKETKSGDEDPPSQSEPPTPAMEESASRSETIEPPSIDLDSLQDDDVTPCVTERQRNPLSEPTTPGVESDSTISAIPRHSPGPDQADQPASSELDTDNKGSPFVSRIPRRVKPAPK